MEGFKRGKVRVRCHGHAARGTTSQPSARVKFDVPTCGGYIHRVAGGARELTAKRSRCSPDEEAISDDRRALGTRSSGANMDEAADFVSEDDVKRAIQKAKDLLGPKTISRLPR